jgi:hypothetical protein
MTERKEISEILVRQDIREGPELKGCPVSRDPKEPLG